MNLILRGSITLAHITEPVESSEFEEWINSDVYNDDIWTVVAVVMNVSDGLFDLLNGTVQVFDALSDGLKFKFV